MHGRFDECLEIIGDIPVPVQQDSANFDNFHVIAGHSPLVITRRLDVYGHNKWAVFLLSFFHDWRVVGVNAIAIKYLSALSPGSSPSQLVDGFRQDLQIGGVEASGVDAIGFQHPQSLIRPADVHHVGW